MTPDCTGQADTWMAQEPVVITSTIVDNSGTPGCKLCCQEPTQLILQLHQQHNVGARHAMYCQDCHLIVCSAGRQQDCMHL